MAECYVSVDIEADGPIPGQNSMLSIGAAAFSDGGELLTTFSVNLEPMAGAGQDDRTMAWWRQWPAAWDQAISDARPAGPAMDDFVRWLRRLPGRPVFVGYPASYDFMWVYWYLIKFTGGSPFGFAALDIKTMAMTLLGAEYRTLNKESIARQWSVDLPHTHVAAQDALEQGRIFCQMLAEARARDVSPGASPASD